VQSAWDGLGKLLWWKERASSQGEYGLKLEKAAARDLALEVLEEAEVIAMAIPSTLADKMQGEARWKALRAEIEGLASGERASLCDLR
jgi:hypothetical protein